ETFRGYSVAPDLFLPLRMEEGYGLSRASVERCIQQFHPRLLVALDCGTSSAAEILDLGNRGVDVIVLDHHEPKSALPECVAIVIAPTARPEVKKLIESSGVKPPIFTEDIGYRLGPRLNAAGRLSTAEKSLRLLLTEDENEARELGEVLDKQNRERQDVEKQIFAAAEEKIAKEFDPKRDAAI